MAFITSEVAGATSKIFPFRCWTIATGAPKEDLAFNTSGIAAKYTISGSTPTTITLVTATQGTFTSSGLVVVNADAGEYEIHLPNAALSSTGRVSVAIYDTTATQVFVCEPIYIDVVGVDPRSASAVSANVTQWSGTNVATVDSAGYPKVTVKSGTGVGELSITSGVVSSNLAQILGTALTETAGQIAAGFKQFFNIASPTSTMNTLTTVTNVTTVNGLAANVITAASMATDAGAEIADAVWDEVLSGHTTAGTAGKGLIDSSSAGNPWSTDIASGYTGTQAGNVLNGVKAKTDQLAFTTANQVDAQVKSMATDTLTSGALAASAVTELQTGLATSAALSTAQSDITAIKGAVDTEVAAIKAKTDSLTFTVGGQVDANLQSINDITVTGIGTSPKFGV